jgi:uncharacterized membrane protein
MKRSVLDQLAADYTLTEPAVALALDLTGARPGAQAWRAFALRVLQAAGIAALGAGAIFFVAANWQDYGVMGRFAILEAAFLACVGLAFWRPPPHAVGRATLVLAALSTGTLLALFGQSYQTGADLYELFFAWALLALPFALAGRSGAVWATWWVVLNVGLGLLCGWLDQGHFLWRLLDRWGMDRALMLAVPAVVNLAGAAVFTHLGRTRFAAHAPRWLVRMLATFGFAFGTAACIAAITVYGGWPQRQAGMTPQDVAVVAIFAALCAGIAYATLREKRDVFPMALILASWIAITTVVLAKMIRLNDIGGFFVLAMWLIATSTAAGFLLTGWVREWRIDETADETPPEAAA